MNFINPYSTKPAMKKDIFPKERSIRHQQTQMVRVKCTSLFSHIYLHISLSNLSLCIVIFVVQVYHHMISNVYKMNISVTTGIITAELSLVSGIGAAG